MSDVDSWLLSDDPELEHIRTLTNAAPVLSPTTPEQKARFARRFFEALDASLPPRAEPPISAVAAVSPLARVEEPRQVVEEVVTVRSPTFDPRAVAAPPPRPFVASPPAEPRVPSPPVDAGKAGPPKGDALEHLKITMPALPTSAEAQEQLGRLPFKPPKPGNELVWTMQSAVLNPKKGQTMSLGDDSIKKPVPALPFVGAASGGAVVSFPRLTVEQYASLCAELALWPTLSDEILPRYHVMNEAARRALSEHWHAEITASAEVRGTFVKSLADYAAQLRAQGA